MPLTDVCVWQLNTLIHFYSHYSQCCWAGFLSA